VVERGPSRGQGEGDIPDAAGTVEGGETRVWAVRNKTDADLLYNCMHEVGLLRAVGVEKSVSNSSEEKMDDTTRKEKMGVTIHHENFPKPATQTQNV